MSIMSDKKNRTLNSSGNIWGVTDSQISPSGAGHFAPDDEADGEAKARSSKEGKFESISGELGACRLPHR